MSKWTKEFRRDYDKKRHKDQYDVKSYRQGERRKELRKWLLDLKSTMQCSRCPESHPACLQFHHVRDKTDAVANMVKLGFGKERILEEIAKCIVLCANCHSKEHFITICL